MIDKKQKIIAVATTLFAEQGFENTPISQICEQAKISKGLVFHHFKNKNELLRAVFSYMTAVIEAVDAQDAPQQAQQVCLAAMIDSIFEGMTVAEHRKMYQLNFSIMVHPTTRAIVLDLIEARYQDLQASTEAVFQALGYAEPAVISKLFIAEIDGIAMNYLLNDEFPIEAIKQAFATKYSQFPKA